ncbi:granzyme A [Bombina bombina]|uniref:granzyme A n=1 Tax=Bombina bombina TaxID=8345 RepID=UPI00235A983A|nr:granzyme A [Bombina bombina]
MMSKFPISLMYLLLLIGKSHFMEIIGGKTVVPHSRPYMALLIKERYPVCGGALIKKDWVLTAAHCGISNNSEVILGAHQWQEKEKTQQRFKVARIVPHQGFNKRNGINDIMLVKLDRIAVLNKYVSILPLPNNEDNIKDGQKCSVAGWGITDPDIMIPSKVLREASMKIVNREACNKKYQEFRIQITNNMLCAESDKKSKDDTCLGDSGGPLMCGKTCCGVTSFGLDCGKIAGVYTRLTKVYLDWIRRTAVS